MMLYELDEVELAVLEGAGSSLPDEPPQQGEREVAQDDWIDELLKEGCPF